ncbi:MAG: hypothetical protein Q9165_004169 [Trypethelium subeluteriae]
MQSLTSGFALFLTVPILARALFLPNSSDSAVGVLWSFPNETWIENLAVRHSGEILCTSLNRAALYSVNPFSHVTSTVHQFEAGDGLLGIAEIDFDVFVVASANVSLATSTAEKGSAKMWKVDLRELKPKVSLVANLADVGLPDGLAALPDTRGLVLLADAAKGVIWSVDTETGDHAIVAQNEAFITVNTQIPLGIDGIHISNGYLFFTNFGDNLLGRFQIGVNGTARGRIETIANLTNPDDFAVATNGLVYVAGDNKLYRASLNGSVDILAGGVHDPTLAGCTSAQFGRTSLDHDVLYIGTNGGILSPVNGIHGGQVLALNVGLFD